MSDAEPKRNWFQFSLRLLILVVVAGNVFWWTHHRTMEAEREKYTRLELQLADAKSAVQEWNEFRVWVGEMNEWMHTKQLGYDGEEITVEPNQPQPPTGSKWYQYPEVRQVLDNMHGADLLTGQLLQANDWVRALKEQRDDLESKFKAERVKFDDARDSIAALKARLKACGCADK